MKYELVPFVVGGYYQQLDGKWVKFVGVGGMPGTSYETMYDENGIHRYTRRDYGRVTGTSHDYPDLRNTPPVYREVKDTTAKEKIKITMKPWPKIFKGNEPEVAIVGLNRTWLKFDRLWLNRFKEKSVQQEIKKVKEALDFFASFIGEPVHHAAIRGQRKVAEAKSAMAKIEDGLTTKTKATPEFDITDPGLCNNPIYLMGRNSALHDLIARQQEQVPIGVTTGDTNGNTLGVKFKAKLTAIPVGTKIYAEPVLPSLSLEENRALSKELSEGVFSIVSGTLTDIFRSSTDDAAAKKAYLALTVVGQYTRSFAVKQRGVETNKRIAELEYQNSVMLTALTQIEAQCDGQDHESAFHNMVRMAGIAAETRSNVSKGGVK